ncbi:MAG: hypothetical protein SWY16_05925 [Cyanobacteriota bacterium]|nr:hypothetical protein [Cyanobacteriota bacterium]
MRLKRWESPRRQGRNAKGKGGAARARQLKKQQQQLRKKLKHQLKQDNLNIEKRSQTPLLFLCVFGNQPSRKSAG